MNHLEGKAFAKYLCALLLFGSNGIIASRIDMNSYEIVFLRTMIGSVLLIALYLFGKNAFHALEHRRDALLITLSGVAMGASWIFLFEAYQLVGVGLSSLLYYCGPVIVMVLSPLVFREKLTVPKVVGFATVIIGVVLVNGNATGELNVWGLFCGAMSAVLYAIMLMLNKKSQCIAGMENSVIQLTVSFVAVAVFVLFRQGFQLDVPADAWPWVLTLGLLNTGIGCYLYFSSIGNLPVQTVAACGYLEPLSAVIFAALLLGESMSVLQIVGAACIIGGAMVGELVKSKRS